VSISCRTQAARAYATVLSYCQSLADPSYLSVTSQRCTASSGNVICINFTILSLITWPQKILNWDHRFQIIYSLSDVHWKLRVKFVQKPGEIYRKTNVILFSWAWLTISEWDCVHCWCEEYLLNVVVLLLCTVLITVSQNNQAYSYILLGSMKTWFRYPRKVGNRDRVGRYLET